MKIVVNGEAQEVLPSWCLSEILERLGYARERVAVAVNKRFIPRALHPSTSLAEGDEMDVLGPQQGG